MRTIRLSTEEVVFLVSNLKNTEENFEDGKPLGKAVLLKLFSLFQEMTTDSGLKEGKEDEITFVEPELWLIRSVVSPFSKMDGKPVGLKLLRKVHEALLSINSEVGLPESEVDEGKYEERKADAEGRPDESDPDDETGDGTEKEA